MKAAVEYSDGVVIGSPEINAELRDFLDKSKKPLLEYHDKDHYIDAYSDFYDKVLGS
jgi:starch synthase